MKKLKGQAIVEFALVLPLFLLLMYGIIYSGMMFHDYSTLSNIARASAREAALTALPSGATRYTDIEDDYRPLLDNLMTSLYTKAATNPIVIVPEGINGVQATINMQLNTKGFFVELILPPSFGVQYYMRKEPTS